MENVFGNVRPALVLFVDLEKHEHTNFFRTFKRASHEFKDKIEFIYSELGGDAM